MTIAVVGNVDPIAETILDATGEDVDLDPRPALRGRAVCTHLANRAHRSDIECVLDPFRSLQNKPLTLIA